MRLSRLLSEIFAYNRRTDNADHYHSWPHIVAGQLINSSCTECMSRDHVSATTIDLLKSFTRRQFLVQSFLVQFAITMMPCMPQYRLSWKHKNVHKLISTAVIYVLTYMYFQSLCPHALCQWSNSNLSQQVAKETWQKLHCTPSP